MVMEYPLRDTEINGAIAEILGRYPHEGWIMNMICKDLCFIWQGRFSCFREKGEVRRRR